MQPTTSGRFRVHDRRPRPDTGGETDPDAVDSPNGRREEFVLVELPEEPVDPADPDAADAYDPLYVDAGGYDDDLAERVERLEPGNVVAATLAWENGGARFSELTVVRESRFRFADDVEGMFEAAVDGWREAKAAGEAMTATTTRSNDGEPNGALYLFADAPGRDTFAELQAGAIPIEPLIARVNERRDDDAPRETFVLRPAAHEFVAVYVVFDRNGVLAQTVRDTYDLGGGLAEGLDLRSDPAETVPDDRENDGATGEGSDETTGDGTDDDDMDEFSLRDRL